MKTMTCREIAKDECADYMGEGPYNTRHFCVNGDKVCVFYALGFEPCNYFHSAVLPAWPDVAAEYASLCGQDSAYTPPVKQKVCRMCGGAFVPDHNRQVYCSQKCVEGGRKLSDKERKQRNRQPELAKLC